VHEIARDESAVASLRTREADWDSSRRPHEGDRDAFHHANGLPTSYGSSTVSNLASTFGQPGLMPSKAFRPNGESMLKRSSVSRALLSLAKTVLRVGGRRVRELAVESPRQV
jgi:hypothetical protein